MFFQVLDPECVQCHAVAQGGDFGVHDVGPRKRHGAGDGGKHAGMVQRVDQHLGDVAVFHRAGFQIHLGRVVPGVAHDVGMVRQRVGAIR